MQLIAEQPSIAETLRYFGRGLLTDWYSWRDWYVLAITLNPSLRDLPRGKIAAALRSELNGRDGSVLELEHGLSLGIFRAPDGFEFDAFINSFCKNLAALETDFQIEIFSVHNEPEETLTLLSRQLNACGRPTPAMNPLPPDLTKCVLRFDELALLWDRVRDHREQRRQPHIMIVDDDELTRGIISQALKRDYALLTAANTVEAVRKHMLFAPNIIFLDINLPDYDGFAFLRHVHQYDPECQIIMFSSNDYFDNRISAFAHGAVGFIAKPFHRATFKHYIDACRLPTTKNTVRNKRN